MILTGVEPFKVAESVTVFFAMILGSP